MVSDETSHDHSCEPSGSREDCEPSSSREEIKTHGSESRGQEEEAVCDERVSYLHVALL